MMKPTVIWLASLLVLMVSMPFVASIGPLYWRLPTGHSWVSSWFPESAVKLRSTQANFQKKNIPLVRLKKDMDLLRLKKDITINQKRDMDVLRLKKSIPTGRNSEER